MIQLTGRQEYIAPNRCKEVIMQLLAENAEEHERMLGGIKDWEIQDEEIFEELRIDAEEMSILLMKRISQFTSFRLRTEEGKAVTKSRKLKVNITDIEEAYTEIQMERQK
jgi:hypothetical protein